MLQEEKMIRFESIRGSYVNIEVQGVEYRVYFEESGQGIPLLCQHTAGAEGLQWRHLMNDKDVTSRFRVIAADLPYHGKSLPPESVEWWKQEYKLTQSFFIDFLVEFSHALKLEKPVFMGCSMGGTMALDLALERPDEFRAVIGIEAAEYIPGFDLIWFDHPRISGEFKGANIYQATAPYSAEKYRREVVWGYNKSAPPVFKGDLHYYSVEHNLTGKLDKIDTSRVAVYILCGEYDIASTPEMGREAANKIKGAEFTEMKKLGHFPVTENYELCKEYLLPILKKIAEA
jgi:pimeloyl-ACP methyl ester carboxylesterase